MDGKVQEPLEHLVIDCPEAFIGVVIEKLGSTSDAYAKYFRENLEYIRDAGQRHFTVDETAKRIGVSNRKIEFLEKLVAMLESGEQLDDAYKLLGRYTDEGFDTPAAWRKWLNENKSQLFFTDVGGYKWMIKPKAS